MRVVREVKYGESLKLVGAAQELGRWHPDQAPDMRWSEGHVWMAEVALPTGGTVRAGGAVAACEAAPVLGRLEKL